VEIVPAEPTAAAAPTSAPPAEIHDLLRQLAPLDWEKIDLDLPRSGFVCSVGAEVQLAAALVKCECGEALEIQLDGESRSRCTACGRVFRHVCLLQDEDSTPSTIALLVLELLRAAGLRS
jgi:hypothetical protein